MKKLSPGPKVLSFPISSRRVTVPVTFVSFAQAAPTQTTTQPTLPNNAALIVPVNPGSDFRSLFDAEPNADQSVLCAVGIFGASNVACDEVSIHIHSSISYLLCTYERKHETQTLQES